MDLETREEIYAMLRNMPVEKLVELRNHLVDSENEKMDIRSATIAAVQIRGGIARKEWCGGVVAVPRGDPRGLHLVSKDQEPAPCWQPTEDDLAADDWIVIAPVSDPTYQCLQKVEDCFNWAGKTLLHINNSEISQENKIGDPIRRRTKKHPRSF